MWSVYVILQQKFFFQKILQKYVAWKLVPGHFQFVKN